MSHIQGLVSKVIAVHELLDSMRIPHQFGGAIALSWYRSPRATADIDLNITLSPDNAGPVLKSLVYIGVTVTDSDRISIERDGQVRLVWDDTYLDLFFATLGLHHEMMELQRTVAFGEIEIPILAPEHLIVCKAVFDRPKDWLDIDAIVSWGTEIDRDLALRWVEEILGLDSDTYSRLKGVLAGG